MKKIISKILITSVICLTNFITFADSAPKVTLTVSHFLSPKGSTHANLVKPWADRIEKQSNGQIKVEIYSSMTLGGKPSELYGQVKDGVVDIIWTVTGYTAGLFPRAEVYELPTVHRNSAKATTLAMNKNFHLIAEDFKDIKPILVHTHAGNALHLKNGCLDQVKDLQELKLRTPSRSGGWMITAMGSEPVGMPVPALPQALSKGVIDGALVPFEIMVPFKLYELTKCSITGYKGQRFGTSVFLFAMNKERYESLPDNLKRIIDQNSGMEIAEEMGAVWDQLEIPGKRLQLESGARIIELSEAATKALDERNLQTEQKWIDYLNKKGVDAAELLKKAKQAVAENSINLE